MSKKCTPLWCEHIWEPKCTKHLIEISKKCTPLWREAHLKVKMYKTQEFRNTFGSWDLEKMHAVVVRSTFRSQKYKNLRGTGHFWAFRCRFPWQAQGIVHLVKSEPNVRVLWQFQLQPPLNYTRLHYTTATTTIRTTTTITTKITLHCATLHCATLITYRSQTPPGGLAWNFIGIKWGYGPPLGTIFFGGWPSYSTT